MRLSIPVLLVASLSGCLAGCLRRFGIGLGLDFDWRGCLFGRRAAASMRCANVSALFGLVAVLGLAAYHPSVRAQSPLNNITKIAAGGNHTCALTASGGVKCWGSNAFGQLGIGGRNYGLPGDVLQAISVPPVAVPVTSPWSLILLLLLGGLITVQVVRRN